MIGEQSSFGLMMDASLLFKVFVMFPNQGTILSLSLIEGFYFSSKGDLLKISKETHVMYQAERIGNVYILRNLKVTVGRLLLSSASKAVIVKQSETTMISSSDVQFYPEGRFGLDNMTHNKEVQIITLMLE